jgi:pimeloyl-ACP methyl ester carboxylesterase
MRCIIAFATIALAVTAVVPPAQAADGTARYVEARGARLYVETSGHGRPILFLHGGATFFDDAFGRQRDDFSPSHTVIGIDQRGHGHSPDGPWELSYQMMADDTAAVLRSLALGPVDVVGHSDGGNVALILARDYPELVRRVVVSGANLRSGLTAQQVAERRAMSEDALRAKLEELSAKMPARFRASYGRVSPDGPDHWMTLLRKSFFMWIEPVVLETEALRRIEAPVLVTAGDHDFTSVEDTAEIARGLPHGQLFVVPGTGHDTMGTRPELVDLAIREFIDGPAYDPSAH